MLCVVAANYYKYTSTLSEIFIELHSISISLNVFIYLQQLLINPGIPGLVDSQSRNPRNTKKLQALFDPSINVSRNEPMSRNLLATVNVFVRTKLADM